MTYAFILNDVFRKKHRTIYQRAFQRSGVRIFSQFDSEGNTVFVNSYNECQHYVSGGWDFTPATNAWFSMARATNKLLQVAVRGFGQLAT